MVVREQLYRIADGLRPDASIEDVTDKLLLLHKIEKGINQADGGKVIPQSEVERRVGEWSE